MNHTQTLEPSKQGSNTVYGPVPSRRLGQSLGVDPIPFKTCNYNCVYCQLGRTTPLTNTRKDFFPPNDILAALRAALSQAEPNSIDYITFVGQGEPTLCASLGRLIKDAKAMSDISVAVITNGALLCHKDVRADLHPADVVIPTLDAADETTFRRINRPWPKFRIDKIIDGMAAFRQEFNGQFWVEVMLVKGVNDSEPVLHKLAVALQRIQPDQIHLNVPIRPPAEAWVEPPDDAGLVRAQALLGDVAPIVSFAEGDFRLATDMPPADAVIEIIRRHPMRQTKLIETLKQARLTPAQTRATLASLEARGAARRYEYQGQTFWGYGCGRFSKMAHVSDARGERTT